MRNKPQHLMDHLQANLTDFDHIMPLIGLRNPLNMNCFLMQLVDSIQRVAYVEVLRDKPNSDSCTNPNIGGFNPIKAAAWHRVNDGFDEACWLTFLITQFSKNKTTGWRLVQDIYGGLGQIIWDWQTVSQNPTLLADWIDENQIELRERGKFGNHRKYESLKFDKTGTTIISYVDWIGATYSHFEHFSALGPLNNDPRERFHLFYASLNSVYRFGRTARFDHVSMLGKLGLVDVEPDSVYMDGATGPYAGANLLFAGSANARLDRVQLEDQLAALETHLNLRFGMQILEDALCNWQKSPAHYQFFNG